MTLGIDATNIRTGGGVTHLLEILSNANPTESGIERVIVWSSPETLSKLPERDWLLKQTHPLLTRSFFHSFIFQIFQISKLAKKLDVNVIFVPGGTFLGSFKNIVSMSQNMLPFEKEERERYPEWTSRLKFLILKTMQSFTFKKSKGVIFLTEYAKEKVSNVVGLTNKTAVISHGINLNFVQPPKIQREISSFFDADPFKFIYVSIVLPYKHQWVVSEAFLKLRSEGFSVSLQLIGSSTEASLKKLKEVLVRDHYGCIEYKGLVSYENMAEIYKNADGFIFASSCENQPIILLEAMSAGLPIASSDRGPMPEVLKDAGFYFDPLDKESIYLALKKLLNDKIQRQENAEKAFERSIHYTWKECASQTFNFISQFKS